jgi:DNA-binding response OmpR family regulator
MTAAPLLLLVEDEVLVQEFLEHSLTEEGFDVTITSNGTQAFAELESDAARFKAVVADIKLGEGPDGWSVGRRARELVHDMPVIYMSGDSAHDWSSQGVPNSVMLAKPFVPAQLITAIATLLNEVNTNE